MTLKEFAEMLDNREYGNEITKEEEQLAKELGFVVVFGYSDDNIEFRGAVDEEIGLYESGEIGNELLPKSIFAELFPEDIGCTWAFGTSLPHEEFHVFEGEYLYCVGIVCDINTKPKPMSNGDRIRAMTDEELAELLEWYGLCEHIKDNYYEICETRGACGGCVLNWLKQPAEQQ